MVIKIAEEFEPIEPPATESSDWQAGRQQNYRCVHQAQQQLWHLQHDCSCRSEPERQVVIEIPETGSGASERADDASAS